MEVGLQDIHARLVDPQTAHTQTKPGAGSIHADEGIGDSQRAELNEEDREKRLNTGSITHPDMVHNRSRVTDTFAAAENERSKLLGSHGLNQAPPAHQEWSVVNISSGGYGLQWTGESTTRAHVGELIALRDSTAINKSIRWRIGVLRWMQFSKDNAFVCGVQSISPRIVPVMVEHKPSSVKVGRKFQKCLLLPEIISIGQASSLISPAHLFRLGELVTIQINGRNLQYNLIDLEEQTGSFSQFTIESTGVGG